MRFQSERAPVFLQLLAHRERWRWRADSLSFRSQDLDESTLPRQPFRRGWSRFRSGKAGSETAAEEIGPK